MIKAILYWLTVYKWLLFAFIVGGLMLLIPLPDGLSPSGMKILIIVVTAVILLVLDPVPLPTIALLIAIFQVLFSINSPTEVAKSFMSDSVFFIMGSLMLAVAIVKQNLDKRIALMILNITGSNVIMVSIGFLVVSALLASVIGEHSVAAIMLPVVITLIRSTSGNPKDNPEMAALLLFSIAYGCLIASPGTPSGGARNAIMIDYWDRLYNVQVSYLRWIIFAFPLVLIQIPVLILILNYTFRSEVKDLSPAVKMLKEKIGQNGRMSGKDWLTIFIFVFVLLLWILLSDRIGLGAPALIGVSLFLIFGLVEWEDINKGVNWGIILLYAGAISMGAAVKNTGAAAWIAVKFLGFIDLLGIKSGITLMISASLLTMLTANAMSHGPAVAILGPIFLDTAYILGENVIIIGLLVAISSSFAYLTILGSPASTIVYSSGYLKTGDFLRAGVKPTIFSLIIVLIISGTYWKLLL
ncbi:MAG: SLC13 family permease [Fidelibacterota bacterium]